MKKFTGWLIIVFCSVLLLIFLTAIIGVILRPGTFTMTTKEVIGSSVGFIVVIFLLIVGLVRGLKKIKKDKPVKTIDYAGTLDINLSGRIFYKDYRNLMLELTFKKRTIIIFIGMMILVSLSLLSYYTNSNINHTGQIHLQIPIFVFVFLFIFIIVTFQRIKKNYQTNIIFQEKLSYRLTNDEIHIKGETVDSVQKWTHFYKIKETKVFFMLYTGAGVAILLDKKMFTDSELADFRRFICSLDLKRG